MELIKIFSLKRGDEGIKKESTSGLRRENWQEMAGINLKTSYRSHRIIWSQEVIKGVQAARLKSAAPREP